MVRRKISLSLVALLAAILAVLSSGCSSGSEDQPDDGDIAVSFNINDPKIKERLGEDDGYAFAVFYGADIHGSLETCG